MSADKSSSHDFTDEKDVPSEVDVTSVGDEYSEYLDLETKFESDPVARKRLLRKMDWAILPFLSLLYLLCSLDKANAGNAKLFGLLEGIGMDNTQYNLALTYFFFTYGLSELPANILLRRLGPRIWFPIIIITWGTITTLTCVVHNYAGYVCIRLALGIAEAGMYPGAYFLLSTWYTKRELQTRMAIFYSCNTLAGAFGGMIAYGVGNLDYHSGWRAWKWLFLIEGVITVFVGFCAFFALPDFPENFKGKWLDSGEKRYVYLRSRYQNGPNPPALHFDWSDVKAALKDWKTYTICMMFWWGGSVPTYALSYTLPTLVKNLGYTAVKAQALTTPPYIFASILCVAVAIVSDRYQTRMKALMFSYTVGLVGIIILWITVHHSNLTGVSYFAIFLATAGYAAQAPCVGTWYSANVANPTKRAAGIGAFMLWGSIGGGSIGSNIFIANEAPTYPLGFGFAVGATVLGAMVPCMINWYLLRRENIRRAAISEEEVRAKYTDEQLAAMGEDSPLFRFTT